VKVAQLLLSRGAEVEAASSIGLQPMSIAARQGDAAMLSTLMEAGAEMDEATAEAAFWAAVKATETVSADEALPLEVPRLLHLVFDADMRLLMDRNKVVKNLTCAQPAKQGGVEALADGIAYIFDDAEHANLPLKPGRRCEAGDCCEACSRVFFPTFATAAETDLEVFPELQAFSLNDAAKCGVSTSLGFVRLIERVRRSIAHEYGLNLATLLPLQAYSRKYVAGSTQKGGGGGEGDHVILHTDEATHSSYHYSSVLYLSTQGEDFEGGSFVWNDPSDEANSTARVRTPVSPSRGAAVFFSSGWENMHEVEPLTSGTRFAVPCFFTTEPVPPGVVDQLGGAPDDDEDVADDLERLLIAPSRTENPMESAGRVKELMMKWHMLLGPNEEVE